MTDSEALECAKKLKGYFENKRLNNCIGEHSCSNCKLDLTNGGTCYEDAIDELMNIIKRVEAANDNR